MQGIGGILVAELALHGGARFPSRIGLTHDQLVALDIGAVLDL